MADVEFRSAVRVEPIARAADVASGLQARLADPLWTLGRQWQFGEFDGEDAGTPIRVGFTTRSTSLTSGGNSSGALHPLANPIDLLHVGSQAAGGIPPHVALAIAGAVVATLSESARTRLVAGFPMPDRPALPDVVGVADALGSDEPERAAWQKRLGLDALSTSDFTALRRMSERVGRHRRDAGESTWDPRRSEYGGRVGYADGSVAIIDGPSGPWRGVEWYHLDTPIADVGAGGAEETLSRIPTRVHVEGAPQDRYWQLEEYGLSPLLNAVVQTPIMVAVQHFILSLADDWWVVPLPLPASSTVTVKAIGATDTFGRTSPLGPAGDPELFDRSAPSGTSTIRTTTVSRGLVGSPVRSVRLVADEQQNALLVDGDHPTAALEPRQYRAGPSGSLRYLPLESDRPGLVFGLFSTSDDQVDLPRRLLDRILYRDLDELSSSLISVVPVIALGTDGSRRVVYLAESRDSTGSSQTRSGWDRLGDEGSALA